jgi:phosphoglycolate phosphatase
LDEVGQMLDRARISAVLFDLDGTLADTDDAYLDVLAGFLRPASFLFPSGEPRPTLRRWLMASEGFFNFLFTLPDRVGLALPLSGFSDLLARVRGVGRPGAFRIIPGVDEMLQGLSAHYPLAVVSSRDRRSTEAFLDQFGLRPLFRVVVSSPSAKRIKPHPAPILLAAERLGSAPKDCLMVGDSRVDIQAGKTAGAQTVGVLCGFGLRQDLEQSGADVILQTTPDLSSLLLC